MERICFGFLHILTVRYLLYLNPAGVLSSWGIRESLARKRSSSIKISDIIGENAVNKSSRYEHYNIL